MRESTIFSLRREERQLVYKERRNTEKERERNTEKKESGKRGENFTLSERRKANEMAIS